VFELPGELGVKPPNCFLNPITRCQIMHRRVSYILYTYDLHHNFVRSPTVKKFNPPDNFSQFKHWRKPIAVPVHKLSISSHFIAVHSWSVRCSRRSQQSIKTPYFRSLGSFKVIDANTTEKLVTSACCNKQHAHAYLQPF